MHASFLKAEILPFVLTTSATSDTARFFRTSHIHTFFETNQERPETENLLLPDQAPKHLTA